MRYFFGYIIIALIFACHTVVAQTDNCNMPWKKLVSRDVRYSSYSIAAIKGFSTTEKILDEVRTERLKAYANFAQYFTRVLNKDDLNYIFSPSRDTILISNPKNDSEYTKIINRTLISDSIYQYRTLENWEFYPSTYKTSIYIKGIAPVENVISPWGEFRGKRTVFWLYYNDVSNILNDNRCIPKLTDVFWQDNFQADTSKWHQPAARAELNGIRTISVIRTVDMRQTDDTIRHHLVDQNFGDSALGQIFVAAILEGKIAAWEVYSNLFSKKLTNPEILKMVTNKPDTMFENESNGNGTEIIKCFTRDFNYSAMSTYKILEEWSFDTRTGKTEIQIEAMAPVLNVYVDGIFRGFNTMFWLKMDEVKDIIARYEQYHPDNTFAMHIWNDYFLSDVKPEAAK